MKSLRDAVSRRLVFSNDRWCLNTLWLAGKAGRKKYRYDLINAMSGGKRWNTYCINMRFNIAMTLKECEL